MKLEITAVTSEIEQNEELDKLKVEMFSGKNAGICYSDTGYWNNKDKAVDMYRNALKSRNHSITEHYKVTILITGIPKIVAMVLNSLGDYCTSERYSKINGNSDDEIKLYKKWITYLEPMIQKLDYGLPDRAVHELAMENARYMLGVFTIATDMSYTTSIKRALK